MKYSEFIDQLKSYAEESYAAFHRSLTPTKYTILGVRVPIMRKIAKGFLSQPQIYELLSYPNEYYEVVFIKLAAVSALPMPPWPVRTFPAMPARTLRVLLPSRRLQGIL